MKTTEVYVANLCVPCNAHCRYCLLSWDGRVKGIEYERGKNFVRGFYKWLKDNKPDLDFNTYQGYCMDYKELQDAIRFARETGSVGSEFLQFNGMKLRSDVEIEELIKMVKSEGVKLIDLTFYGIGEYHDKFAGRSGDFDLNMSILNAALKNGLKVKVGLPVTQENMEQVDELIDEMEKYELDSISVWLPHDLGRGKTLAGIRMTKKDYEVLPDHVKKYMNMKKYKTPAEWKAAAKDIRPQSRVLNLGLTKDNIDRLEHMTYEEIYHSLEKMDDEYYKVVPTFQELLDLYCDDTSGKLYRTDDLYRQYQERYKREKKLDIYDMNDQRQTFSIRY